MNYIYLMKQLILNIFIYKDCLHLIIYMKNKICFACFEYHHILVK